jgi:hypothetical protein
MNYYQGDENANNKETGAPLLHAACFDHQAIFQKLQQIFQTFAIKANTLHTVCDLQTVAPTGVHCYLWHEVRRNRRLY